MKGRIAWVTGGGRGIGRSCALALARAGASVAVTARSRAELDAVVKELKTLGAKASAAPADVTDARAVDKAHKQVAKELGAPDVLVNAAGLARSAAFLKTDAKFMEELWRLNLLGSFHTAKAALPAMLEKGWGRIVNVASVAGKHGAPYIAAYASAKHAVLGLTRSLAAEFATKGITVNAVCPGYVDTRMTKDNVRFMMEKTGRPEAEILEHIRNASPQKRLITPDEVAAEVAHLCTDAAFGINGQAITIDGGGLQW